MNTEAIRLSNQLAEAVPLLAGSNQRHDYEEALKLVEYLIEHEPDNPLVDLLCARIAHYEDNDPAMADFNSRQGEISTGPGVLRVLIEQHNLSLSDFENEIGKKSLVSRILSGERQLTVSHIRALCARFGLSPSSFF
ncbi:transcriptional regulator [Pantoea vagans]|uniref:helix-turn-helix domain-containing protein n=1 Tax=Pantoea TaxID=53335 RepID=UPI000BAC80D2|nr:MULTISPECIES: helix-turn-helix domain-containing protein [Pantoea]MBK5013238.1 helix-turn-helix domain-containing protein [Pantoea sp. S62]PAW33811.1 transcriptional regulator [Pantoea vagans]HBV90642.1 helix-turn-helix domain-containing protein [Pantoea sp.]